jgi:hypothetical protein
VFYAIPLAGTKADWLIKYPGHGPSSAAAILKGNRMGLCTWTILHSYGQQMGSGFPEGLEGKPRDFKCFSPHIIISGFRWNVVNYFGLRVQLYALISPVDVLP